MPITTSTPRLKSGVFVGRTVPLLVGLGFLTACGAATSSPGTSSQAASQTARPTSGALPAAVFAFESSGTPSATWSFTDSNGTVLDAFTCVPGDGRFVPVSNNYNYVGGSNAILAHSVGISPSTKWTVIQANGTSTAVATSLTPLLNTIGFPGDFLVAPSTLYMVQQFPNAKNPFKFLELNLATGTILETASLVPLTSSRSVLFEPENIDVATHQLSFLIANTTFENVKISALSVVTLDLITNVLTVHSLAAQVAADILPPAGIPQYVTTAYVSGDGSLLTYQTPTGTATYVLNLKTGRTATLAAGLNLAFVNGQNSVYYSPTNEYAALIGAGPAGALRIFVIKTATGALVKNIAVLIPKAVLSVQIMDWASPTDVIYATNETTSASTERTSLFDLQSAKARLFPTAVGQFISVLP
jgi:hypothetical protein